MISTKARVSRRVQGFTLVEAIITIVLIGIIAGVVAVFIVKPVQGYLDAARRAEMTDAADTAIRRLAREVRAALPNSLRTSNTACIEFLPIVGGGRYRESTSASGTGSAFNFSTASGFTFDVLGDGGVTTLPSGTNHVVVFNLGNGVTGSDAYAGLNRRQIGSIATASTYPAITLAAGSSRFQFESPGKRFHVIADYSVMYACTGGATGKIIRTQQPISSTATACPSATASSTTTLVSNVDCTSTAFTYAAGASQRYGLLNLTIRLTQNSESVQLFNEVNVNNVP